MKINNIPDSWFKALKLRNTGITFREVGENIGVSANRARYMCMWAEIKQRRMSAGMAAEVARN